MGAGRFVLARRRRREDFSRSREQLKVAGLGARRGASGAESQRHYNVVSQ